MLLGGIALLSVLITAAVCLLSGAFLTQAWLWVLPVTLLGSVLGLVSLAFIFLWILSLLVDRNKPQEHDSKFYRAVLNLYIDAIIKVARIKVKTSGLEQIPQTGRFLLVSNHLDNVDPAFLLTYFRKHPIAFISKKEVQDYFLIGKLMHKILCQPIDRENDREALKTILKCISLIKEDKVSVAVFPEGYILPHRKFHSFRPGVFKIAQKTKVPIVVCTLRDTQYAVKNFLHLKPSTVELRLLKVVQPEEYAELSTVELSHMIYEMMKEDLGPERVAEE